MKSKLLLHYSALIWFSLVTLMTFDCLLISQAQTPPKEFREHQIIGAMINAEEFWTEWEIETEYPSGTIYIFRYREETEENRQAKGRAKVQE